MVPPVLAWTARVALSIVLYSGSGAMWYSPSVAGTVFLAAAHPDLAKAGTPLPPPDPRAYPAAMMGASIAMPLYVFLLHVVGALHSAGAALGWAVGVALFSAGLAAPHGWFEGRDPRLFWVHAGYHAVGLVAVALVLALLP